MIALGSNVLYVRVLEMQSKVTGRDGVGNRMRLRNGE